VKEKRQLKLEKKQAAAAAKLAANEDPSSAEALETPDEDEPETPEP